MSEASLSNLSSFEKGDIILKEFIERNNIYLVAKDISLKQIHHYQIEDNSFRDLGECYHVLSEQYFDVLIQLFSDDDIILYFTLKFVQEIVQICIENILNPVSIHYKLVTFNNQDKKFYYPQQLSLKILEKENVFIRIQQKLNKISQEYRQLLSKIVQELIYEKKNPNLIKNYLQEYINKLHIKLNKTITTKNKELEKCLNNLQRVIIQKYTENNLYQIAKNGESNQQFNSYDPHLTQIFKTALIYRESLKNQKLAQCFLDNYQLLMKCALDKEKYLFQDIKFRFDLLKINKKEKNEVRMDTKRQGDFIAVPNKIEEISNRFNQNDYAANQKVQNMSPESKSTQIESLVQFAEFQINKYVEKLKQAQSSIENFLVVNYNQKSKEWEKERKLRITASNFGKICKAKDNSKNTIVNQIIESKFFTCEAIQYGNNFEEVARLKYIEIMQAKYGSQINVKEFGLIVDKKYNWIAGSPDGIVYENNNPIVKQFNNLILFQNQQIRVVQKQNVHLVSKIKRQVNIINRLHFQSIIKNQIKQCSKEIIITIISAKVLCIYLNQIGAILLFSLKLILKQKELNLIKYLQMKCFKFLTPSFLNILCQIIFSLQSHTNKKN
ncbi:YqaJ-like viral recombinase domain protein (macronuclear) [Tetrahymena thermophila SB210]|uniref:YqaJ-like viral recombinase domain protein n=1 Tax=Tetrahymena thermophila (strain SB210) TaxID=312017 RepID=W7WXE6_TETTS|nr:YqaJ-like viral recombinase domain protein [Tetrahymena thermophila SB210]EWS71475.1 YqaJ-like viral recombinase domain protein [Tetrahymena thermophila SB210]|eukprot:XP_012655978.1 YqaJ-like viral recombinase domain protein [Tetrahymena thermophila SB210]